MPPPPRPGRRPSGGISQPQSIAHGRPVFHDDGFAENSRPQGHGVFRPQHEETGYIFPRGLSSRSPEDDGRPVPREHRAPPRYGSIHRSSQGATTPPAQPQQSNRRLYYSDHGESFSQYGADDAMTAVDSVLYQAAENLHGPDYYEQATEAESFPPPSTGTYTYTEDNEGQFQAPLGLDPDLQQELASENRDLFFLCNMAGKLEMNREHTEKDYIEHDQSWNPVRDWLEQHSVRELQLAMENQDNKGRTAMHCACQHQPPLDIMTYMLQHCPASLETRDVFDWLPLHYACAFSAAPLVLQMIAETCKQAKTAATNRGLTPLHLALIGPFRDFADTIAVLASTGASRIADDDGILPLHYGCAFGASEEVIRILVNAFPNALCSRDKQGRDPLIFAIANIKTNPKQAPKIVALLLSLIPLYAPNANMVNSPEGSSNPFEHLVAFSSSVKVQSSTRDICAALKECLVLLLAAGPAPSPTVLSTIRSLPSWLFPTAILSRTVQDILDEKIKDKYPTVVLMFDLYVQIVILVCLHFGLENENESRYLLGVPLFIGGGYFLLRELVQVITLIWLSSFRTFLRAWFLHVSDWLDLLYIVAAFFCGVVIYSDRNGELILGEPRLTIVTFSCGILWAKLFVWLRSISIDFSVFVSGVFYVSRSLLPYVVGLLFFMVAFTQIFNTLFRSYPEYGCEYYEREGPKARWNYYEVNETAKNETMESLQCEDDSGLKPFCNRWDTFLHVYTMFLGEIDEADFVAGDPVGLFMYALFVFLMVILLANVLIAIVTDSYKFIQDSEAAMVFYTNRLYFLAETDAIANFPCFQWFASDDKGFDDWSRLTWDNLFFVFDFSSDDFGSHWVFRIIPTLIAGFAIPCWLLLGFGTCGGFWPPQVREWIFTSKGWKRYHSTAQDDQARQQDRRKKEEQVAKEVVATREEFFQSLSENRHYHAQIRASVIERKQEIRGEMRRIRVLMGNLFEQAEQLRAERAAMQSDSDSESY